MKSFPAPHEPLPGHQGEIPFKQFYTAHMRYFHGLDHKVQLDATDRIWEGNEPWDRHAGQGEWLWACRGLARWPLNSSQATVLQMTSLLLPLCHRIGNFLSHPDAYMGTILSPRVFYSPYMIRHHLLPFSLRAFSYQFCHEPHCSLASYGLTALIWTLRMEDFSKQRCCSPQFCFSFWSCILPTVTFCPTTHTLSRKCSVVVSKP